MKITVFIFTDRQDYWKEIILRDSNLAEIEVQERPLGGIVIRTLLYNYLIFSTLIGIRPGRSHVTINDKSISTEREREYLEAVTNLKTYISLPFNTVIH